MGKKNERVWVVSQEMADQSIQTSVFDNEADAVNFYDETLESIDENQCGRVMISETTLMRRVTDMADNESPWGVLGSDINKEFVEGLIEDMHPKIKSKLPPDAAERFMAEKSEEVRKRATQKFNDYLKDELNVCVDEWCKTDMEY